MKPKELLLPPHARVLWRHVRPDLPQVLHDLLREKRRWTIGDGTVLAAQWNHRTSTDIDLKIERDAILGSLHPKRNPKITAWARDAGATRIEGNQNQLIISFGASRLDIFCGTSKPLHARHSRLIDGREEHVQNNSQILYGKIQGRGPTAPVRDLYDIAVVRIVDRNSLEHAVNCVQRDRLERIASRWEALENRYREAASKRLRGIPEQYHDISKNPAATAATAVLDCRYRRLEIERTVSGFTIEVSCEDGHERRFEIASNNSRQVRKQLEKTGVAEYVRQNRPLGMRPLEELTRSSETRRLSLSDNPNPPNPPGPAGEERNRQMRNQTPPGHERSR
jgi:hypothetical protein